MTFMELAQRRRSVRSYADRPIEREKLMAVLEAGRIAPSACNNQPWRLVVVQKAEERAALFACYGRDWIRTAPAAIIVCADHEQSWKRRDGKDHADVDAAILADHLTLAAADLGLGTCWVCAFDAAALRDLLRLPPALEPVVLLPIGYPAEAPGDRQPSRRPLESVVQWGL